MNGIGRIRIQNAQPGAVVIAQGRIRLRGGGDLIAGVCAAMMKLDRR
jgi:hypothetical protein